MTIEELRAAMNGARERMVGAHEAAERSIAEGTDPAEHSAAFDVAETEFRAAQTRFERALRIPEESVAAPVEKVSEKAAVVEQAVAVERSLEVGKTRDTTYHPGGEHSIFRDMLRSEVHHDRSAAERLSRHAAEVRDLSQTDSAGGQLVAPVYLQNEFVSFARAGRPVADLIGSRPLPSTDTFYLPTMDGGTATGAQTENGAVTETDATFASVTVVSQTLAGMQDVSQQLLDRSVPGIDQVIYADLRADYDTRLDSNVLNSTTTSAKGLIGLSGTNGVTYTAATPTSALLYSKVADAIQQVHTGIFMPPTHIIMHPRRWAALLSSSDTGGRPLVVPLAQTPQNVLGTQSGVVSESIVGSMQGLPVVVDSSIPTTGGAGTNQDTVIVARVPELFLYEQAGGPFLEMFRDVGSGTMTVRFRLHNYWAQAHGRRPKAISVITGTGLVAPSF
jgi:HK97 family phage major capsid protein